MSRFSEGLRRGAGFGRDTLAPLAVRLSSRSSRPVGDCSLADSDALTSTVVDMWFSTLLGGGWEDEEEERLCGKMSRVRR